MSTRPRTPEHFPRMRDRAAGRRLRRRGHRVRGVVHVDIMPNLSEFASRVGRAVSAGIDNLMTAIGSAVEAWFPPARSDLALTGAPAPTWGDWLADIVKRRQATGLEPGQWRHLTTVESVARRRDVVLPVFVNDFPRDRLRYHALTDTLQARIDVELSTLTPSAPEPAS